MTFGTYHSSAISANYKFQPDFFHELMWPCGRSSRPYCEVELFSISSSSGSYFRCRDCKCWALFRGSLATRRSADA